MLSCTLSEKKCPSLCPSKTFYKLPVKDFPSTLKHYKMQFIIKNTGKTSVRNKYGKSLGLRVYSFARKRGTRGPGNVKTFAYLY